MEINDSIKTVAGELDIVLKGDDATQNKQALIEQINLLIIHDFNRLVNMLYRMDVSEARINDLLKQQAGKDAAEIIAALMIERELQRIRSRRQFKQDTNDISEEERW